MLNELLKAKKAAEAQFRKARAAFEGPKTNRKKGTKRSAEKNQTEDIDKGEKDPENAGESKPAENPTPTISLEEFVS